MHLDNRQYKALCLRYHVYSAFIYRKEGILDCSKNLNENIICRIVIVSVREVFFDSEMGLVEHVIGINYL